jgi:hypothetical protein
LFTEAGGRPILIGEGSIGDSAVGEDVEVRIGLSSDVMTQVERIEGKSADLYLLTVTNASPRPVRFEAELEIGEEARFEPSRRLARRDGRSLWAVEVPANGRSTLRYRLRGSD